MPFVDFHNLKSGVDKMIQYASDEGHSFTDHNRYLHQSKLAHLVLFASEVLQGYYAFYTWSIH